MAITIHNLTNSPFDLLDDKGEKVRIGARETLVGFKPHPRHENLYRQLGYFRIEEGGAPAPKVDERDELPLADQYRELAGKDPDKRWSNKRLLAEIEKLQ